MVTFKEEEQCGQADQLKEASRDFFQNHNNELTELQHAMYLSRELTPEQNGLFEKFEVLRDGLFGCYPNLKDRIEDRKDEVFKRSGVGFSKMPKANSYLIELKEIRKYLGVVV